MNHPLDVHPEDLLDRERDRKLTPDERARLDAHTSICSPCAFVRAATLDFEAERKSAAGDAAMIDRISSIALGTVASIPSPGPNSSFHVTRPRRARRAWAVAAVVMFAATGATASFWSVRHGLVARLLVQIPSQPRAPAAQPAEARPAKPATALPLQLAAPNVEPLPQSPPSRVAAPVRTRATEEPAPASADQIFAAANEARRRGDSAQTVKLYRQLQQQFPGTREEINSRYLLARLLQDRGEDPAQCLSLFTRYLAESPNGTLAEEARLGRALALMRLGRTQEERQAWQDLLSSYPKSIHAERAQKRLDELR